MSWKSVILDFCQTQGPAARSSANAILSALLPGAPAVVALVDLSFDAVRQDWEPSAIDDLPRVGQMVGVLSGPLRPLMAQVTSLRKEPARLAQAVEDALAADEQAPAAARALTLLARSFDRLEQHNRQLLAELAIAPRRHGDLLWLLGQVVGVSGLVEDCRSSP